MEKTAVESEIQKECIAEERRQIMVSLSLSLLLLALLKGCSIVGVFWGQFTMKEPKVNAGVCERTCVSVCVCARECAFVCVRVCVPSTQV